MFLFTCIVITKMQYPINAVLMFVYVYLCLSTSMSDIRTSTKKTCQPQFSTIAYLPYRSRLEGKEATLLFVMGDKINGIGL